MENNGNPWQRISPPTPVCVHDHDKTLRNRIRVPSIETKQPLFAELKKHDLLMTYVVSKIVKIGVSRT